MITTPADTVKNAASGIFAGGLLFLSCGKTKNGAGTKGNGSKKEAT